MCPLSAEKLFLFVFCFVFGLVGVCGVGRLGTSSCGNSFSLLRIYEKAAAERKKGFDFFSPTLSERFVRPAVDRRVGPIRMHGAGYSGCGHL